MKKHCILFLYPLITSLLLSGCQSKSTIPNESVPSEAIEESSSYVEPETESMNSTLEEAVKEGMVRSIYTNEWVNENLTCKRPIAVMFPGDKSALPQFNIGKSSILYECMEEGGMSRQMGIIEDWNNLEKIGNIRSCRLYYLYLADEWDPIFIHFGGVYYMKNKLAEGDIDNLSGAKEYGTGGNAPGSQYFYRSKDKSVPHNAYISGKSILDACNELGYSLENREMYYSKDHFQFSDENTINVLNQYNEAATATEIDLSDCYPVTKSSLKYDEASGSYLKYIYGKPQVDGATNEQLSFENVLVQSTYYETLDAKGYLSFKIHDDTRGGFYFTKGKCIPIKWKKTGDHVPTKYYDLSGKEIKLNTGKTYIAIIQDGTNVIYK